MRTILECVVGNWSYYEICVGNLVFIRAVKLFPRRLRDGVLDWELE